MAGELKKRDNGIFVKLINPKKTKLNLNTYWLNMVLVGVVDGVGRESSSRKVLLFILDVNRFKTSSILELVALFKLLLLLLLCNT